MTSRHWLGYWLGSSLAGKSRTGRQWRVAVGLFDLTRFVQELVEL